MKFVVLNARINGHNCSWADEIYKILGDDFVFIEFKKLPFNQKGSYKEARTGVDFHEGRPYVLRMYESEANRNKAYRLIERADVLRVAGLPNSLLKEVIKRVRSGKLTYTAGERPFKKNALLYFLTPKKLYHLFLEYILCNKPNYRILCQSAFVPNDVNLLGNFKERCYKFAYIHQVPHIDIDQVMSSKSKDKVNMFWCARFLDWKHPELPVLLAKQLIESGRDNFHINMVGSNTLKLWGKTKKMVSKYNLENYVTLTGGIPNTEVLRLMRESNIFLFTSDRNEGWGVVLNEAMSSGCACVASNEIGAAPFLINNGQNGLLFESKSVKSLLKQVCKLYDNPELCKQFGYEAYKTITGDWSAKTAALRLVKLSESILSGNEIEYKDGICSKAYKYKPKNL